MPCYSKLETKLIDLETMKAVAKALGIELVMRTKNSYTLRKGNEYINIERKAEGEPFFTVAMSGSNRWDTEILQPLTVEYTKSKVKAYYKSKGYSVSFGQSNDELVFTKYS